MRNFPKGYLFELIHLFKLKDFGALTFGCNGKYQPKTVLKWFYLLSNYTGFVTFSGEEL